MKSDYQSCQFYEQIFPSCLPMGKHDFSSGSPGNGVILQFLEEASTPTEGDIKLSPDLPASITNFSYSLPQELALYLRKKRLKKGQPAPPPWNFYSKPSIQHKSRRELFKE